ncbi:MAG: hypothetical protein K1X94_28930 [Sandaracinaceae bacterium]|nr:hypothetical protein [Sandaracinaceae bacterium]
MADAFEPNDAPALDSPDGAGPCAAPATLPTCTAPAALSYCDPTGAYTMLDEAVAEDLTFGPHASYRVGVLPVQTLAEVTSASSNFGFDMRRGAHLVVFGYANTDRAIFGTASWGDAVGSPASAEILAPVSEFYPQVGVSATEGMLGAGERVWGPFTFPPSTLGSPTRTLATRGEVLFAGETPIVATISGSTVTFTSPPAAPSFTFTPGAATPGLHGTDGLVYTSLQDDNSALELATGHTLSLGPGEFQISFASADGMQRVYATADGTLLSSRAMLRVRQFACQSTSCGFYGDGYELSLGAERQAALAWTVHQLDTSLSPLFVVTLLYQRPSESEVHLDALIWRGVPLAVTALPIAVFPEAHALRSEVVRDVNGFEIMTSVVSADGVSGTTRVLVTGLRVRGCD